MQAYHLHPNNKPSCADEAFPPVGFPRWTWSAVNMPTRKVNLNIRAIKNRIWSLSKFGLTYAKRYGNHGRWAGRVIAMRDTDPHDLPF